MAFTAAEKISMTGILGWSYVNLDSHLTTFVPVISADIETAVRTLIDEYEDLDIDDGVEVFPNMANFGARVKNAREVAEMSIKRKLMFLLNIPSEDGVVYLERG